MSVNSYFSCGIGSVAPTNTSGVAASPTYLNLTTDNPMIFWANGRFWSFFVDGSNNAWYSTSTDGLAWTAKAVLTASVAGSGQFGGVFYSIYSDSFFYDLLDPVVHIHYWRYGRPNEDGTISWAIAEQSFADNYSQASFPTFDVDVAGNLWSMSTYGIPFSGGVAYFAVWKNGVQTNKFLQSGVDFAWDVAAPIIRTSRSNPSNICFFGMRLIGKATMWYSTDGGLTWSNFDMPTVFSTQFADAVVVGNKVYIVYPTTVHSGFTDDGTGPLKYVTYNIGDAAVSAETSIDTIQAASNGPGASIATDNNQVFAIVYVDDAKHVRDRVSTDGGATWSTAKTILTQATSYNRALSVWPFLSGSDVVLSYADSGPAVNAGAVAY